MPYIECMSGQEIEGTAKPANVLADSTFMSIESDSVQVGTMANNGQYVAKLTPSEKTTASVSIPEGYHDGTGYIYSTAVSVPGDTDPSQVLSGKTFCSGSLTAKTGTMTNNGSVSKTFTPSTSAQTYTIPEGYHDGTGKVTCNVPSMSGTASAAEVVSGKTFYTRSLNKQTGTMIDNSGWSASLDSGSITIPKGYHDGTGTVSYVQNMVTYPYYSDESTFIVVAVNDDKSIDAIMPTDQYASVDFVVHMLYLESGSTYSLSGCPAGGSDTSYALKVATDPYAANVIASDTGNGTTFSPSESGQYYIVLYVRRMTNVTLTFYPMLETGSVIHPYVMPRTRTKTMTASFNFVAAYDSGQLDCIVPAYGFSSLTIKSITTSTRLPYGFYTFSEGQVTYTNNQQLVTVGTIQGYSPTGIWVQVEIQFDE